MGIYNGINEGSLSKKVNSSFMHIEFTFAIKLSMKECLENLEKTYFL